MKIGLLNLPVDNNYGGMLQRYALMKVLQSMGHDPIHLQTIFHWPTPSTKEILKRTYYKIRDRQWGVVIFRERKNRKLYEAQNEVILPFYKKYIKHSKPIITLSDFKKYQDYDAYIVGSDQSWRKSYCVYYPYETMFLSWLRNENAKRITYGVSFGKDENELTIEDIEKLSLLFEKFAHVSVRESTAIDLIKSYGWKGSIPMLVLDPTLLLEKELYVSLINDAETNPIPTNIFCYVLDLTKDVQSEIDRVVKEKNLSPFVVCPSASKNISIEQWLRCFCETDFVITDSYHGLVFATIFNKPFHLIRNNARGGARFDSLISLLYKGTDIKNPNWSIVNQNIEIWKDSSLTYLSQALN